MMATSTASAARPRAFRFRLYNLIMRIRPAALADFLKKLLGVKREVIEVDRGRFFIDPASNLGLMLWKHGEYEPPMYAALSALLKQGSTFVDLGANEGYFTVVASRIVGPSGRIISIEPQQRLRSVLAKNMELNDVRNVTVVTQAVSNTKGQATMHVSPSTNTGSTGLVLESRYRVPTQIVETTTLAELFREQKLEYCDVMKVDIEGFEYEAILGSPDVFEQGRVRRLVLQLHPHLIEKRGLRTSDITDLLARCGYTQDTRFEEMVFVSPKASV